MNRLQNKIKTKLKAHIQDNWTNYLASLEPEDGSLFNMTKNCTRPRSRIPPLQSQNVVAYSENSKAEMLASAYEKQFVNNPIVNPTFDNNIHSTVTTTLSQTFPLEEIESVKTEEITDYIKKLKVKKAPGREGITNKMVKNLPPTAYITLATILTAMLRLSHFPSIWKSAVIIPILKPQKTPSDPESYRPISLLPILGKIAEVIIRNRLLDYLTKNNKLIPQQFGFMRKLSTTHQLLRVTEYIAEGFTRKESVWIR